MTAYCLTRTSTWKVDALRKDSPTGDMQQKKHVSVEGGASTTYWRENFLETSVHFFNVRFPLLCSLKCCLVELQFTRVVPFGVVLRKIASMPTPSSSLDRLIILGKQPTLLKPIDIVSDSVVTYPLCVMFCISRVAKHVRCVLIPALHSTLYLCY